MEEIRVTEFNNALEYRLHNRRVTIWQRDTVGDLGYTAIVSERYIEIPDIKEVNAHDELQIKYFGKDDYETEIGTDELWLREGSKHAILRKRFMFSDDMMGIMATFWSDHQFKINPIEFIHPGQSNDLGSTYSGTVNVNVDFKYKDNADESSES